MVGGVISEQEGPGFDSPVRAFLSEVFAKQAVGQSVYSKLHIGVNRCLSLYISPAGVPPL